MAANKAKALRWAKSVKESVDLANCESNPVIEAARYILETIKPDTMADIGWNRDIHTGMLADLYASEEPVVMLFADSPEMIHCASPKDLRVCTIYYARHLAPTGEYLTSNTRLSGVDATLETAEDYQSAPIGTIVLGGNSLSGAWEKTDESFWSCSASMVWPGTNKEMAGVPRKVVYTPEEEPE